MFSERIYVIRALSVHREQSVEPPSVYISRHSSFCLRFRTDHLVTAAVFSATLNKFPLRGEEKPRNVPLKPLPRRTAEVDVIENWIHYKVDLRSVHIGSQGTSSQERSENKQLSAGFLLPQNHLS